jgi:glucose-1-phosphate thymidylyltransferase
MTQKAVVLARGLGTRMQREAEGVPLSEEHLRAARAGQKALMPLLGRPMLDYVVDSLLQAGLRHVCLVIAPEADAMRQAARRIQAAAAAAGARIECAVQQDPRGTADAVLAAEDFAAGDAFVVCNGDNLYPWAALRQLAGIEDDDCRAVAFERDALLHHSNIAPERIRAFAAMTVSEDGRLTGIVEKPPDPERYAREGRLWVNMNLYRFVPAVFDACRSIEPDPVRGELELTAAVAELVRRGRPAFRVVFSEEGVLDLTSRADISGAERALAGRRLSF